jgi:hypothetical protein
MYTTSTGIRHIQPFLQRIPHILDNTPTLKQLVLRFRHQPFHIVPRRDVQSLLSLEEPSQLLLLQQIPSITHEDSLEVHNQIFQRPIVLDVPR